MSEFAETPQPPYYAVIFTSKRTEGDNGYGGMADLMVKLVSEAPGFLGFESAREDIGITVSYWKDMESITSWKENIQHMEAQKLGKEKWYSDYKVRIAKVESDH